MAKISLMEKFVGQYVDVLADVSVSLRNETEEGMFEKNKPYVISGYFTGYDDENIYIGTEEGTISDCFNRQYVVHIGISKPYDKYESILDGVQTPSDENFN